MSLSVSLAAAARTAGSERTITVRTDTRSAAAVVAPSTGRGTTTRSITGTVRCSPLAPARLPALLAVASMRRSRTSSLGFATPSPARLGATRTVTTGAAASTGPTTIGGAGPRTLRSRGTHRPRGARDRPLKPRTRPRERPCRLARGPARLLAPTRSAVAAAAAVAGIVPSSLIRYNVLKEFVQHRLIAHPHVVPNPEHRL